MLAGLFCGKAQNSPNGKKYLLDIIKGAKIPPNMQPDQSNTNVTTCSFNKEEQQAILDELNSLLAKEIVKPALHSQGEIISPVFAGTKKDGNCRLILNLKQFNKAVEYEHFKMDTIETISHLIVKDRYMASVDLKDAYYCIAMHPEDRKFLRFAWNQQLYQFTCFPNGLACCPGYSQNF